MPFLFLPHGLKKGNHYVQLKLGKQTVGSSEECDIRLNLRSVSKRHALIHGKSNSFFISELGSKNGTTVNGSRIQIDSPRELEQGDVVIFGEVRAIFCMDANLPESSPNTLTVTSSSLYQGPEGERLRLFQQIADIIRVDRQQKDAWMQFAALLITQLPTGTVAIRRFDKEGKIKDAQYPPEAVWIPDLAEETAKKKEQIIKGIMQNHESKSAMCVPIEVNKEIIGLVLAASSLRQNAYTQKHAVEVSILANLVGSFILNTESSRQKAFKKEIKVYSSSMEKVIRFVEKYGPTPLPVIITGETGTGKELVAQRLHDLSDVNNNPYVIFDCSAKPFELFSSELFGHVRGAFTGAIKDRKGALEKAKDGTIFFDEIYNLPLEIQGMLLRVLQEKKYQRLGEDKVDQRDVKARFIFATNKDLAKEVTDGNFREDLFFRIRKLKLFIPPLRERKEKIRHFAELFIDRNHEKYKSTASRLSSQALEMLEKHHWPGNVRELESVIERALINTSTKEIMPEDIDFDNILMPPDKVITKLIQAISNMNYDEAMTLVEREIIVRALRHTSNNVTKAHKLLKISDGNLRGKIVKYNIRNHVK